MLLISCSWSFLNLSLTFCLSSSLKPLLSRILSKILSRSAFFLSLSNAGALDTKHSDFFSAKIFEAPSEKSISSLFLEIIVRGLTLQSLEINSKPDVSALGFHSFFLLAIDHGAYTQLAASFTSFSVRGDPFAMVKLSLMN